MSHQQSNDPYTALCRGIDQLGLTVPEDAPRRLLAYVELLAKWNRTFNLTAIKDPEQMVIRHILDSLVVLPYIKGTRILDVGSGAGLPGIPLAVVKPQWSYTLLDKQGKKTRFMLQAVAELGLGRVEVVHQRVEAYQPPALFDSVITRAYASLRHMVETCGRLCAPGGRLLAMKGKEAQGELQELPRGYRCERNIALQVPGLDAARHLVVIAPGER
ncbi:MAG TPA: 16S rRNA (guanine(527)-N(7))-methyltransferase RsmG [Gammaproteobacteria bacterium]|nr:16S rRNA (guanine(527)-N(7))-methyltransferase RsmG [Gammaproteobacteria bacterium]